MTLAYKKGQNLTKLNMHTEFWMQVLKSSIQHGNTLKTIED